MAEKKANSPETPKRELNASELLNMKPDELNVYITANYVYGINIPRAVLTRNDLIQAQPVLATSARYLNFMESMRLTASIQKSVFKDAAASNDVDNDKKAEFKKQEADMRLREQIFKSAADRLDMIYKTTSRLISIKSDIDKADGMSGGNA